MTEWIALSDAQAVTGKAGPGDGLLTRGVFVLEFALPLQGPTVLLDYRADRGWEIHLSVFADPLSGISILHRQGSTVVRHALKVTLPEVTRGTGRIVLAWDAPGRRWCMGYETIDGEGRGTVCQGADPLPLPFEDVTGLSEGQDIARRSTAVLWFGFAEGLALPDRFPWIGPRTPIATPRGLVPAGLLSANDIILTADHGPLPVTAVHRHVVPTRGSYTPVLLRAPYVSAKSDLLLSSDQRIAMTGVEVEYLFGEEEVLVEARHLVNGRSAMLDTRRATTTGIELDFGLPVIVLSDGCRLGMTSPQDAGAEQPRRVLREFEATPLVSMLGRTAQLRLG